MGRAGARRGMGKHMYLVEKEETAKHSKLSTMGLSLPYIYMKSKALVETSLGEAR